MLLSKGFEVEVYTGTPEGDIVGFADQIAPALDPFVREPDSRNVEYTTAPLCCYHHLLCALLRPRQQLRQFLRQLGNFTLIPGSTLHLENGDRFYRSDPGNPFHTFIEENYGTAVVTASIHINIGIRDPEVLMRACRLVRLEAPLFLALSASSPFLQGKATGYHSNRWHTFPQTPDRVPLFTSHRHFIRWTNEQLASGTMHNIRHLWCSVRPNGDRRPYNLNRLELRICDLIVDPIALLAITALLEARLWQLIGDPTLDPLTMSQLPGEHRADALLELTLANEIAVAHQSLDAELHHWQDGRPILARDWIQELYQDVWGVAKAKRLTHFLSPVQEILHQGNTAQQWLQFYDQGLPARTIIQQGVQAMADQELELMEAICPEPLMA